MTQVFDEDGNAIPVTVVELLPLTVTQVKTEHTDGYSAVQVGYQETKEKHLPKPLRQRLVKNKLPLLRKLKEYRVSAEATGLFTVGDVIDPADENSFLQAGATVHVTGHSIGKGFQGTTKRWGHSRGPMSHGSKSHRLTGSIGAGTTPGNVQKGQHMPNKMGNARVTTTNLTVVKVFGELDGHKVALVKGSVPGVEGGFVFIKPQRDKWNNPSTDIKFTPANGKKAEKAEVPQDQPAPADAEAPQVQEQQEQAAPEAKEGDN